MTILDARSCLERLSPTESSIIEEAIQNLEAGIENLPWEVYDHADADTFAGLNVDTLPGIETIEDDDQQELAEHIEEIRSKLQVDLNAAGEALRRQVVELITAMRGEYELEMLRLTT